MHVSWPRLLMAMTRTVAMWRMICRPLRAPLGVQLDVLYAGNDRELEEVFLKLSQSPPGGLVISSNAFLPRRYEQLAYFAIRHGIPTIASLPLSRLVASWALLPLIIFGVSSVCMPAASLRATSQPICRSSGQQNSRWRST